MRLDWNGDEQLSSMHDGRATAAPLLCSCVGPRCFHTFFLGGKHMNLPEQESLISLFGRVMREGIYGKRPMVLVIYSWSWELFKKDDRAHER